VIAVRAACHRRRDRFTNSAGRCGAPHAWRTAGRSRVIARVLLFEPATFLVPTSSDVLIVVLVGRLAIAKRIPGSAAQ
jgi:hypothetical protein